MWNKTEEGLLLCPGCGRKLEEVRINIIPRFFFDGVLPRVFLVDDYVEEYVDE